MYSLVTSKSPSVIPKSSVIVIDNLEQARFKIVKPLENGCLLLEHVKAAWIQEIWEPVVEGKVIGYMIRIRRKLYRLKKSTPMFEPDQEDSLC